MKTIQDCTGDESDGRRSAQAASTTRPSRPVLTVLAPVLAIAAGGLGACSPTVKVEAPDKPIEINLNINIKQEIRVRVERDAEEAIEANPEIF